MFLHGSLNVRQPGVLVVVLAVAPVAASGSLAILHLVLAFVTFLHVLLFSIGHLDLKLNENKIRIRYTIYKYKSIRLNKNDI